jgi:two-component system LytT family response regulator
MLRVILIDDEPLARQGLRKMLSHFSHLKVVGEADDISSAVILLRQQKPDGIFLDINLPGTSGFELLQRVATKPPVIFVTAYAEHAVQAFDVQAVDYLLKPVRPERLAAAVDRLTRACGLKTPVESPTKRFGLEDRLCLRTPQRTIVTAVERIAAFQAQGDFVLVSIAEEPALLICQTLTSFEPLMPHPPFLRLDRSVLVNLARLVRVEQSPRSETKIFLQGVPAPLLIGRTALARMTEALALYRPGLE